MKAPRFSIIVAVMLAFVLGALPGGAAEADRGDNQPLSALTPATNTYLEKIVFPTVKIECTVEIYGHEATSSGSGSILNSRYILTAYHVVDTAIDITAIVQPNETRVPCTVVCHGDLDSLDYAILQMDRTPPETSGLIVPGNDAPEIEIEHFVDVISPESFGNLATGQEVVIAGHPLGGEIHITEGRLCAKTNGFYSTSAPVIHGNSGGPVFTDDYQLVGVLVRVAVSRGVPITHINFFVPLSSIKEDMHDKGFDFVWAGEAPPPAPEEDQVEPEDTPEEDEESSNILMIGRYETITLLFHD